MSHNRAHITLIRRTFAATGATLPKPVLAALADREKLDAAALPNVTTAQIAEAVTECLLADRDPLDDEQVRRLTTARTLGGVSGRNMTAAVADAADWRVVAAMSDNVAPILHALGKAANEAGQQLAAAYAVIGDHDLSDSDPILRLGPDAARHWVAAREAQGLLKTISSTWFALAELTRFAAPSTDPVLRLAALDLTTFEEVGRGADAWAIVQAGATIELADGAAVRERTERLTEEREQREAMPAEMFRREFVRLHGGAHSPA